MASSQSSGKTLAGPLKLLTRSVQRVHDQICEAMLKQERQKLTKGFESKSSDMAFSKVKQELQTEHDQAI
jgi:hypothetical protein